MKYYITCVQKQINPYGIYEDEERLKELVICKDCLKKNICLMYRQCKDDYGYCSWAKRKEECGHQ